MPQILDYLEVDKNTQLIKTIEEKNVENGEAVDGKEPPQGDNPANKVTVKGIVKNQGEEVSRFLVTNTFVHVEIFYRILNGGLSMYTPARKIVAKKCIVKKQL